MNTFSQPSSPLKVINPPPSKTTSQLASPVKHPIRNLSINFEEIARHDLENAIRASRKTTIENISDNKIGSFKSLDPLESSNILGLQDYDFDVMAYDDLASQMASPKLSEKMQMIFQSNVNLSESIIQNTYKAVDASRMKLENKDLQVELEITELKLHHLDKKMEGCLQSSKNTLAMNAKLSENVSRMISPTKNSSIILPEIKPRDNDSRISEKVGTGVLASLNPSSVRVFSTDKTINQSSLVSKLENISNEYNNQELKQNLPKEISPIQYSKQEPLENKYRNLNANLQESQHAKRSSIEVSPTLEAGLEKLANSPYFTFNHHSNHHSNNLSITEFNPQTQGNSEGKLEGTRVPISKIPISSESKKMALPKDETSPLINNNRTFTPITQGATTKATEYSGQVSSFSKSKYNKNLNEDEFPRQSQSFVISNIEDLKNPQIKFQSEGNTPISREVTLRDKNGKEMVYILKPKAELSFEKLETISVSFTKDDMSPSEQNKINKGLSNAVNFTPKSWNQTAEGERLAINKQNNNTLKVSQNSPNYFINIPTLPSEKVDRDRSEILSIAAHERIEQSYQEDLLNQDKQSFNSLKYHLNQPKYQQILYGDNNYSVTARSLQKKKADSPEREQKSRASAGAMMQKVQEFKKFLSEFEEVLYLEQKDISPSESNKSPEGLKRLHSSETERLTTQEARTVEMAFDKYSVNTPKIQEENSPRKTSRKASEEKYTEESVPEKKVKKGNKTTKEKKTSPGDLNMVHESPKSLQSRSPKEKGLASFLQKVQPESGAHNEDLKSLSARKNETGAIPTKPTLNSTKSDQHLESFKNTRKNTAVVDITGPGLEPEESKEYIDSELGSTLFLKSVKNARSVSFASDSLTNTIDFTQPVNKVKTKKKTSPKEETKPSSQAKSTKTSPVKSILGNSKIKARKVSPDKNPKVDFTTLLKPGKKTK